MAKWEYQVVRVEDEDNTAKVLNYYGQLGYELEQLYYDSENGTRLIFRRQLKEKPMEVVFAAKGLTVDEYTIQLILGTKLTIKAGPKTIELTIKEIR